MNKIELVVDGKVEMTFENTTSLAGLATIWGCLEATPVNSDSEILVDGTLVAFRYGVDCLRTGAGNNDDFFAPLWV